MNERIDREARYCAQICHPLPVVLARDEHETIIRLAPRLMINRDEADQAIAVLREAIGETDTMQPAS